MHLISLQVFLLCSNIQSVVVQRLDTSLQRNCISALGERDIYNPGHSLFTHVQHVEIHRGWISDEHITLDMAWPLLTFQLINFLNLDW